MRTPNRHPVAAIVLLLLAVGLGVGSRRYAGHLPQILASYAGDTLWALALFLFLGLLLRRVATAWVAAAAFGISTLVEVSQLYHAPWIDAIRQTTIGGLVLGFGFLWSDLVCYAVGVGLGVFLELGLGRLQRLWTNWLTWPS